MSRSRLSTWIRSAMALGVASILGCAGGAAGGGGTSTQNGDSGDVVLAPETVVVDDTDSVNVTDVRDDSVVLTGDSSVSAGQILAGRTSDGAYLRKVVDSETQPDGTLLVRTEQASIEEAVTVGSASISQQVFFDGGGTMVGGKAMPSGKALDTQAFSVVSNASVEVLLDNLEVNFNPDIDLDLRYGWTGLKEFRAVVTGELDIDLKATVMSWGAVNNRYEKEIAEIQTAPIFFTIGLLPVEVTPVLEIIGGVEINASGSGSATLKSGLTLTAEAGVHYERGDWSLIGDTNREVRSPQLTYEFDVGGDATIYVKVQVLFKFYHLAGPHIGISGGLGFAAETSATPPDAIDWELYWSIAGSAGGSLEILSKKVFDMSFDLFEFRFVIDDGTVVVGGSGGENGGVGGNGGGGTEVDSDGDGVPDDEDGCPYDQDKTEPGDCGCGNPETCGGPAPTPTGETITLNLGGGVTMELVRIPAGTFMMGSDDGRSNEQPVHNVTISRDFYIGRYEVTQAQWEAVMGTSPWASHPFVLEQGDSPATYVSWDDAVQFCQTLSASTGYDIRLPSEAEWEYATRAGTTTEYSFGDDVGSFGSYAWYTSNTLDVGEKYAHPVGRKLPNPWGLYDVHGNVWEWCEDWYFHGYSDAPSDGSARTGETEYGRVLRGGSWLDAPDYCRSAYRLRLRPSIRDYGYIGFRCALGT